MLRLVSIVGLAIAGVAAGFVTPAAAQTCWITPGLYVDTDPSETVVPGLVMNVSGMPCWADVRILAVPDQPFDPYLKSLYESDLEPLQGDPPYDNPNGCPYKEGQPVDLKDQYNVWYPGLIASASPDCGYQVNYWVGQQQKVFGASHADLRLAMLPMPAAVPGPAPGPDGGPAPRPELIVQACATGSKVADLVGDEPDTVLTRALIDAINTRQGVGTDFSVSFDSFVEGESALAAPGSVIAQRYQDAGANAVVRRYRMVLNLCAEDRDYGNPPSLVRYRYDQSCYTDVFGDLICAIDNAKPM